MAITNLSRDWGVKPSIVRIVTTDNYATITATGYLTSQIANIQAINFGQFDWTTTDYCLISYSGGEGYFTPDFTVNYTFVPAPAEPGSLALNNGDIFVGNASNVAAGVAMSGLVAITNSGVTSVPLASGNILVGSAGGAAASVAMTGAVTISNTGVTSLANSVPQVIRVPITSANFKTAYTAGLACIAAAGANTIIVINSVTYTFNYLTAAYTAGGAIGLQYSSAAPVNAGGFAASATVSAATLTGLSAAGYITAAGALAIASAAQAVNVGVWLTVASANFASGSGTVVANISYQVITV